MCLPKKLPPAMSGRSRSYLSAIKNTNRAYLFDNSTQEHLFIAEFEEGKLLWVDQNPPTWFVKHVLDKHLEK